MNREIKFRVWKNNTMLQVGDGVLKEIYFDENNWNEDKDGVLMQYIGLKDKNGKEIYEGDILLDDAKIPLKCFYDNGKFMAGISYASQEWFSECESIGNIFENKDLLK